MSPRDPPAFATHTDRLPPALYMALPEVWLLVSLYAFWSDSPIVLWPIHQYRSAVSVFVVRGRATAPSTPDLSEVFQGDLSTRKCSSQQTCSGLEILNCLCF